MLSLRTYPIWVITIILAAGAALVWAPRPHVPSILFALMLAAIMVGTLYLSRALLDCHDPLDVDSRIPADGPYGEMGGLDPWKIQHMLMKASDQELPEKPVLTNGSVLYAALILEEGAETLRGIVKVLQDQGSDLSLDLANALANAAGTMALDSVYVRMALKGQEFSFPLRPTEAVEIFDGTTDLAVVNCGFALASGLDGSMGYEEVAISNLSKRNPKTGKIDKTPDGKWIKGANYQPPNLKAVLAFLSSEEQGAV